MSTEVEVLEWNDLPRDPDSATQAGYEVIKGRIVALTAKINRENADKPPLWFVSAWQPYASKKK